MAGNRNDSLTNEMQERAIQAVRHLRREGRLTPQDAEEIIAGMNSPTATNEQVLSVIAAAGMLDLHERAVRLDPVRTAWNELREAHAGGGDDTTLNELATLVAVRDEEADDEDETHPGLSRVTGAIAEHISQLWPTGTSPDPAALEEQVRTVHGDLAVDVLRAGVEFALEMFTFGSDATTLRKWVEQGTHDLGGPDGIAQQFMLTLAAHRNVPIEQVVIAAARLDALLTETIPRHT